MCYEKATGAVLNIGKSQALTVGTWDTTRRVFGISYSAEIKDNDNYSTVWVIQLGTDHEHSVNTGEGGI